VSGGGKILPIFASAQMGRGTATLPVWWWRGRRRRHPSVTRLRRVPPPHLACGKMGRIVAGLTAATAACAQPLAAPHSAHPTIVSLNPCTDAILADVTAPGQLLAVSHYSHERSGTSMPLAQARRFPATGGSVEEVLALDPEVVVTSSYLDPASAQAFARLGIRVETVGIASSVRDSVAQVRRLAALAGERARGEALASRIEGAVVAAHRPGQPVSAVLWQEGGLVPGDGTLAAELLANSGFANQAAARGLGQGSYLPLERVLADPPQVVIAAGDERMEHHPALRHLHGVRYASIEPNLLYCGGPTIPRLAARLAALRDQVDKPLLLAGGVWGGSERDGTHPPPAPPASGRGDL
jgi:iron complex transport system substrate-binding protein